ncbi:MAG TPA: indolepyruvate ferredoxin oxidoreductase subunit alpha [Candidatus Aquicultor sp.]|jgi:indolepyruvate ferredoxin oxidoreductase alpha subunit
MKVLLTGNEAIAHGAYAAGVTVACGYPGTPSTEILESLAKYEDVDASWAPNEKVALEVGIGASLAGARALVTMKHVGLNVAADPLFTLAYTGVNGGIVVITADDPGMHSSQNEQDNRHYAKAAKIPMLEPSDSSEAAWLIEKAFTISERFDTPVLLRTTTRVNHSKSLVDASDERVQKEPSYEKDPQKYVMVPAHAQKRREVVESRMAALADYAEEFPGNRVEWGDRQIGFITSGISYQYVRETFPEASVLKIAMINPLPKRMITDFIDHVERAIVVEELDPYIEDQIRGWGLTVEGRNYIPGIGELNTEIIREALNEEEIEAPVEDVKTEEMPQRPPMLCPGCPHRGVFYTLSRMKLIVNGDIGCYTLGVMPPLNAMDSCICMGASIGNAEGMHKATGRKDIVAVIGDSTFVHSGITPLINTFYNQDPTTTIILDNRTTAMTGRQGHAGTGVKLQGENTKPLDFEQLTRAIGIESVQVIDPYELKEVRQALEEAIAQDEPSVIISQRPCLLVERSKNGPLMVTADNCIGCKVCLRLGCPSISWKDERAVIDTASCVGCGVCAQLCKSDAIVEYTQPDKGAGI